MITIRGNTFPHREYLKSIRARYDGDRKCWTHHGGLSDDDMSALRSLAGVSVEGGRVPPPPGSPAPPPVEPSEQAETIVHGNTTWQDHFAQKNGRVHFGFDSIAHHVEFVRAIPFSVRQRCEHPWSTSYDKREFTGTRDFDTALHMLEHGDWPEGIECAQEIIEFFSAQHAKRKQRRAAIVGGHVNVGRLLAGNPKHMISRPKLDGRRTITLFVSLTAKAGIQAMTMAIRAAVIAALADLLESNGYRCEIIAANTPTRGDRCAYSLTVCLKRAGDRLNLSDIVFTLGHPSYLRRIIFATVASQTALEYIWQLQGRPAELFDDDNPLNKNEIYIERVSDDTDIRGSVINRALQIFAMIVPDDFPISINTEPL